MTELSKCWTCVFWRMNSGRRHGTCRRYPPTVIQDAAGPVYFSTRTTWLSLDPNEGCGEHQRAASKALNARKGWLGGAVK